MDMDMGRKQEHQPFEGLSAWFSSSIHPSFVRRWIEHGGTFASDSDAQYLFSDNAFAADTIRVFSEQTDICLFLSSWILEVIRKRSSPHDIPVGKHCLQPHYFIQHNPPGDPYATPKAPSPARNVKRCGSRIEGGGGGRKKRKDGASRSAGQKDVGREISMEDSQQYITENKSSAERLPTVVGIPLVLSSEEYFVELEKALRLDGAEPAHIDDHESRHPSLHLVDFDLHSQEYTMRRIKSRH